MNAVGNPEELAVRGRIAASDSTSVVPSIQVDRRTSLTRAEFLHDYVMRNRPVIITDATSHWPAMTKFTWEFFQSRYGHVRKEIRGVTYSLGEAIDRIMVSTPENPAPYPFNLNIEKVFPELLRDLAPEIAYGKVDRVNHLLLPRLFMRTTVPYELFFGGNGAFFPRVHYDALWLHNQMTQIIGSKEYFFFPYEQREFLYPGEDAPQTSQVDFGSPDYERYPLFAKARATVFTLRQGETIFFPGGVWHATRIHEPSLTFGRVQLNGVNWPSYVSDVHAYWKRYHPSIAPFIRTYLNAAGRVMDFQERFQ